QRAGRLGRADHGQPDAVLDRAARVGRLQLEPQLRPGGVEPRDPDQGRAPDQLQQVGDGVRRRLRVAQHARSHHTLALRRRSALPITDTELRLMAAAAYTGDSTIPNSGYRAPAAIGTPRVL